MKSGERAPAKSHLCPESVLPGRGAGRIQPLCLDHRGSCAWSRRARYLVVST